MNILYILLWITLVIRSSVCGYLQNYQLVYIKNILASNSVPNNIKNATRKILITHYLPWCKKIYRDFISKNKKQLSKVLALELYQYAIYGLVESVDTYSGYGGLHKYAEKFIIGRLSKGMTDLVPLKPLNHYQRVVKHEKVPPSILVSFDDYWKIETMKLQRERKNDDIQIYSEIGKNGKKYFDYFDRKNIAKNIKKIVKNMPPEYRKILFLRYSYDTLYPIRNIKDVCILMEFSHETYYKKMRIIQKYLKYKLHQMVFE